MLLLPLAQGPQSHSLKYLAQKRICHLHPHHTLPAIPAVPSSDSTLKYVDLTYTDRVINTGLGFPRCKKGHVITLMSPEKKNLWINHQPRFLQIKPTFLLFFFNVSYFWETRNLLPSFMIIREDEEPSHWVRFQCILKHSNSYWTGHRKGAERRKGSRERTEWWQTIYRPIVVFPQKWLQKGL